jgi:hypothetical protein
MGDLGSLVVEREQEDIAFLVVDREHPFATAETIESVVGCTTQASDGIGAAKKFLAKKRYRAIIFEPEGYNGRRVLNFVRQVKARKIPLVMYTYYSKETLLYLLSIPSTYYKAHFHKTYSPNSLYRFLRELIKTEPAKD